jgi:hypothetical protein
MIITRFIIGWIWPRRPCPNEQKPSKNGDSPQSHREHREKSAFLSARSVALWSIEKLEYTMKAKWIAILSVGFLIAHMNEVEAQPADANYDESKVGTFTLPDPLRMENGQPVKGAAMWKEKRRPELVRLFEEHVYGRAPGKPETLIFEKSQDDRHALGGKAIRREVAIYFKKDKSGPRLNLLLYVPNDARKPAPAFIGLNFDGNHTINADPGIAMNTNWVRGNEQKPRGSSAGRWQAEKVIGRGYALATMYYGDIDPDFDDGFTNGVHALFPKPGPGDWGSIATWAWGLSRVLDYLETDRDIDSKRVALTGHSRLGKTALWAGAIDERFAIVISNNSGCGGASLSRRNFGETVARINKSFPHWFCDNFQKYNNNENACPVDQHELIALIAPRPVYVASAAEDLWADPRGEFLSAKGAEPVYKLLGTDGLPISDLPEVNKPAMGTIGYHIRTGKHDVTEYDWEQFLNFADRHFGRVLH